MTFSHYCVCILPIILKALLDIPPVLQLSGFSKRINFVDLIGKIAKPPQIGANLVSIQEVICTSPWYL